MCEWVRNNNLKGPWKFKNNPRDWEVEVVVVGMDGAQERLG